MQKVLGTYDLISLGVGSSVGTGMYLVAGMVAKTIAGPAVVLSYLIAGLAALLSGLCYAELGVRVPHTTGSAYVYTYVVSTQIWTLFYIPTKIPTYVTCAPARYH